MALPHCVEDALQSLRGGRQRRSSQFAQVNGDDSVCPIEMAGMVQPGNAYRNEHRASIGAHAGTAEYYGWNVTRRWRARRIQCGNEKQCVNLVTTGKAMSGRAAAEFHPDGKSGLPCRHLLRGKVPVAAAERQHAKAILRVQGRDELAHRLRS